MNYHLKLKDAKVISGTTSNEDMIKGLEYARSSNGKWKKASDLKNLFKRTLLSFMSEIQKDYKFCRFRHHNVNKGSKVAKYCQILCTLRKEFEIVFW